MNLLKEQTENIADYNALPDGGKNTNGGERWIIPFGELGGATVSLFVTPDLGETVLPLLDEAGNEISITQLRLFVLDAPLPSSLEVFATVTGAGGSTNISLDIR